MNKNQINETLKKKISDLLYHNLVEWRYVGKGSYSRVPNNRRVWNNRGRGEVDIVIIINNRWVGQGLKNTVGGFLVLIY